jgi:hypothetical protein
MNMYVYASIQSTFYMLVYASLYSRLGTCIAPIIINTMNIIWLT